MLTSEGVARKPEISLRTKYPETEIIKTADIAFEPSSRKPEHMLT